MEYCATDAVAGRGVAVVSRSATGSVKSASTPYLFGGSFCRSSVAWTRLALAVGRGLESIDHSGHGGVDPCLNMRAG